MCPGKNAVAVAELAMGLLLAIDRRIPDNVADARAGAWNKKLYSKGGGLLGKTIGIIGLGQDRFEGGRASLGIRDAGHHDRQAPRFPRRRKESRTWRSRRCLICQRWRQRPT